MARQLGMEYSPQGQVGCMNYPFALLGRGMDTTPRTEPDELPILIRGHADRHAAQCAHLSLDREGVLTRLRPSDLVPLSASTKEFVGHVPRLVFEVYGAGAGR